MPSKSYYAGARALRPDWKQRCHDRLNSIERDKAIKEVIAVLDPTSSIDEVAALLAERYPNFYAITWKEFYLEWLNYDGAPPGYGTMNSEPWMSDEIFTKIVNEELAKQGPDPSMTSIAEILAAKYGVYSAASYKRHAQNRIGGENPSTVRSAATVHHNPSPTVPSPRTKETPQPTATTAPSDKKPTIPFMMSSETLPKRSPRLSTPSRTAVPTTWTSTRRAQPNVRPARKAPPTPPSTSSSRSRSVAPGLTTKQLKHIFDTHHHLVKEGMEELRFARWLDRMHQTSNVAYWMNMHDAWMSKDGIFEHMKKDPQVDEEDEEEDYEEEIEDAGASSESNDNWAPRAKRAKR